VAFCNRDGAARGGNFAGGGQSYEAAADDEGVDA